MRLSILLPAFVLAACGPSAPSAPPAEAAQLRVLADTLVGAIAGYGVRAGSMADPASCRFERSEYEARVGPAIQGVLALAPRVDSWVRARGSSEHADLACGGAALLAEFERHTDIACTSVDMEANRSEAAAHVLAMNRWAGVLVARAEEAAVSPDGEGVRSGPRCVQFGDGGRMFMP